MKITYRTKWQAFKARNHHDYYYVKIRRANENLYITLDDILEADVGSDSKSLEFSRYFGNVLKPSDASTITYRELMNI